MTSKQLMETDSRYVMQTYGRFNVAIDHGQGATLYSPEGKKYIDFTSGIGVNSVGCGNEAWRNAISAQAAKLGHISNLFYTEPYIKLAEALCVRTGMKNAFFSNSGAEANEGAIKLARKYSFDKYGKGRAGIITLKNSFHGRTVTTLAATGQDNYHKYFFPFTEGFTYAAAGDVKALEDAGAGTCAVMLELVQGEGGVLQMDPAYVCQVEALCRKNDWLLIVDEVQTGVGRTGSLFAFIQYGISPDVVTFAKGIAGGLPLGGLLSAEAVSDVLTPGTHAATFGGNPVCCAAALAVLETLSDEVIHEVTIKGQYIKDFIVKLNSPHIAGVRGLGLMLGVAVRDIAPKELAAELIENGLLCLTAGSDAVRFLPPLTITYEEIDEGLEIFNNTLVQKGAAK